MMQPSLLDIPVREDQPRKRVRQVSRAVYAELRDGDHLGARAADILRGLAAFVNRFQEPPTALELTAWLHERGEIARNDPNLVRPRLTELCIGVRNPETGQLEGGGVLDVLPRRQCRVSGKSAHPWKVRER